MDYQHDLGNDNIIEQINTIRNLIISENPSKLFEPLDVLLEYIWENMPQLLNSKDNEKLKRKISDCFLL